MKVTAMRALVLHGPGSYRVERDWPMPVPEAGWALVRVDFTGVCGSDLPRFATTGSYRHPMILGHEFSGRVDKPAEGSNRFKQGDPVAIMPIMPCGVCAGCRDFGPFHCQKYRFLGSRDDGGFAEYAAVPETNLFLLPKDMDTKYGTLLEPLAVALHVARRSGFKPGNTALVFGAGAIGLLVAQWLKVFGATRVLVADLRRESRDLAAKCGVDAALDPTGKEFAELEPVDHVFEAAGSAAALVSGIERVRSMGDITVVGRDTKDLTIPLPSFERLMRKEVTLRGCWGYNLAGEHEFVRRALADNRFVLEPLITHVYGLDKAEDAVKMMLDRKEHYGKVLLDCRS